MYFQAKLLSYSHSWRILPKGTGTLNWYRSRKKRVIPKCFMEISRYCFNFVFSAEQSTFTLFSKLEVLRSAPITKLNMYDFLWLLLWTSFKIKVWSQFYHNNNNNNNNNDNDNNNLFKKKLQVTKPLLNRCYYHYYYWIYLYMKTATRIIWYLKNKPFLLLGELKLASKTINFVHKTM